MEVERVSNIHSVTASAAGPHREPADCPKPKPDAPPDLRVKTTPKNITSLNHTWLKFLRRVLAKSTCEQVLESNLVLFHLQSYFTWRYGLWDLEFGGGDHCYSCALIICLIFFFVIAKLWFIDYDPLFQCVLWVLVAVTLSVCFLCFCVAAGMFALFNSSLPGVSNRASLCAPFFFLFRCVLLSWVSFPILLWRLSFLLHHVFASLSVCHSLIAFTCC